MVKLTQPDIYDYALAFFECSWEFLLKDSSFSVKHNSQVSDTINLNITSKDPENPVEKILS